MTSSKEKKKGTLLVSRLLFQFLAQIKIPIKAPTATQTVPFDVPSLVFGILSKHSTCKKLQNTQIRQLLGVNRYSIIPPPPQKR
jgi:hypothetical protein